MLFAEDPHSQKQGRRQKKSSKSNSKQFRFLYTVYMYSIKIRINHLKKELVHTTKECVGVRLKTGHVTYKHWRGFTLNMDQPIKLVVEGFTLEEDWDPRSTNGKMPRWHELKEGEYLLGSWSNGFVYTVLPFRIIN